MAKHDRKPLPVELRAYLGDLEKQITLENRRLGEAVEAGDFEAIDRHFNAYNSLQDDYRLMTGHKYVITNEKTL